MVKRLANLVPGEQENWHSISGVVDDYRGII